MMIKVKLDKKTISFIKSKSDLIKRKVHGVYFLKHNGVVVYVGQSINIKARILSHIHEKAKVFNDFSFIRCKKELLESTEINFIHRFDPVFNKKDSLTDGLSLENYCNKHSVLYEIDSLDSARNASKQTIDDPVELKDFDHAMIAKHFKISVGTMLKLKKSGSRKWVIHVKAYLYDMSKL